MPMPSRKKSFRVLAIVLLVKGIDVPGGVRTFREFAEVARPLDQQPAHKHLVLAETETEEQKRLLKYEMDPASGASPIDAVPGAKQIGVAAM
ncbi:hypothetical protein [Polymorphobacter megasporae]|uniref:hypothetical protein n=1 Tax=Glacieibacterium megasporae TaxID=2835787 RepID=UPI001C1E7214|nr:hypothetical protein [Polymorphobacter megasporae]UAJ12479.1 hypothetical protein KTC28_21995 [Polymorphobacter megasporae]